MKMFLILILLVVQAAVSQIPNPLSFHFDKKYGQVEVGGPFAGAEFHKSRPLPSRISFYYPVANSIDISTDYWKRYESMPMAMGLKIGNGKKQWIGNEGWEYILSPHSVTFFNTDSIFTYQITYEFCLNEPAMVITIRLKNITAQPQHLTAYAHLLLALRTCQTYARKDSAVMMKYLDGQTIIAQFSDTDTKLASVFVMNAAEKARQSWFDANQLGVTDYGRSKWSDSLFVRDSTDTLSSKLSRAAAAFEYEKKLQHNDELLITWIVGTTQHEETIGKITSLTKSWKNEIQQYDAKVREYAVHSTSLITGDQTLDRTIYWAKAILASNAHYLDGQIVPMPCPAEYNFFFTHDLLMTDLGVVNYDLERVKRDLRYVASLGRDSIIPHAYYWRDDGFKTEFCTPSNWNHLWFIEVSARYLRHSLDTVTIRSLYPLITKSLNEMLTLMRNDNLMYAYRPDWWDIGWNEGPRTYITTLGIRQIENYLFIASLVDPKNPQLKVLERKANLMRSALVEKLWDDSLKFLINYNGSDIDRHKYMGSLLAPALRLLDEQRSAELLSSAKKDLLAPDVGIRAAMPADFHTDSSIAYFKFAGKEAGDPYAYINGGVWPHNNAWYALALHAIGKSNEAKEFVKRTMSIDGVAQSPNGVPAMYEYRYSDEASPRYGEIDKPSFLWASGFYLYTLYTLAGMNDNMWNLSFSEHTATFDSTVRASYSFSTLKNVEIAGAGNRLRNLFIDGVPVPSLVIPVEYHSAKNIRLEKGIPQHPYLKNATAIVHSVGLKKNVLFAIVSSFKGHSVNVEIVSAGKVKRTRINQTKNVQFVSTQESDGLWNTKISFTAGESRDTITIEW